MISFDDGRSREALRGAARRAKLGLMRRYFACLLSLALTSCVAHEATRVALAPGASPSPNLVQLRADPMTESMFGLPHGALTSEATLVRADASSTCLDVVLRGDFQPRADVALDVDGAPTRWQRATLAECRVDGPCLPHDSHLARYATDLDPHVTPRAARICFEGVPVARRALMLRIKEGVLERRFEFDVVAPIHSTNSSSALRTGAPGRPSSGRGA